MGTLTVLRPPRYEKVKVKPLSCVRLFATPWTVAYQAPQSMEFSRQEYWSGLPFPSPGDLPNPGNNPKSPALHAEYMADLSTLRASAGKESTCNEGDLGLIPGLGGS